MLGGRARPSFDGIFVRSENPLVAKICFVILSLVVVDRRCGRKSPRWKEKYMGFSHRKLTGPYYPIKASLSVFCVLLLRFSVPNTAAVEEANELLPHEYDQPFN